MLISLNSRPFLSCGPNLSNDKQFSRYGLSLIGSASTTTSLSMGLFFDAVSRSFSAPLAASWFFHASSTNPGKSPFATSFETNRSEEHTSELQSQSNLVCRLLLEKKKRRINRTIRRSDV